VPHGSELNQVWTNVVGNATDAIGRRGTDEHRPQHWPARVLARRRNSGGARPAPWLPAGFAGHLGPASPVTGSADHERANE
jgi:hypothetical protein